jgi:hypothetical protein
MRARWRGKSLARMVMVCVGEGWCRCGANRTGEQRAVAAPWMQGIEMGEGKLYSSMRKVITSPGPRGAVATSSVPSLVHHHPRCRIPVGRRQVRPVKRRLRLTSGPRLHFVISLIFNHPTFEIQNGDLLDRHKSPNFARRQFET